MKDERRDKRRSLALTVKTKWANIAEYVEQRLRDISKGGIIIRTRTHVPEGTLVKFDIRLRDDSSLIRGVGNVVWSREKTAADASPAGIGIKFLRLDPSSKANLNQILAASKSGADPRPGTPARDAETAQAASPATPEEVPDDPTEEVTEEFRYDDELLEDQETKLDDKGDWDSLPGSAFPPPTEGEGAAAQELAGKQDSAENAAGAEASSRPREPRADTAGIDRTAGVESGAKKTKGVLIGVIVFLSLLVVGGGGAVYYLLFSKGEARGQSDETGRVGDSAVAVAKPTAARGLATQSSVVEEVAEQRTAKAIINSNPSGAKVIHSCVASVSSSAVSAMMSAIAWRSSSSVRTSSRWLCAA